jgi:complement component 1 Q subcomponent-binding protein
MESFATSSIKKVGNTSTFHIVHSTSAFFHLLHRPSSAFTMMSLSKFARSAPRAALRTATPSIRQTPFASSIRSKISQQTPRLAAFSTSQWRSDSCRPKLTLKLDSELQIEREESSRQSGSDQAIEEFKNDNPSWTIEDVEGEQEVFLRKKFEDEDVTVYFNIADFNNDMDAYENDMDNAISDEDLDMDTQSHGANSKGAVNQGQTKGGNFKVAPEDGVTPADREELADDEVRWRDHVEYDGE